MAKQEPLHDPLYDQNRRVVCPGCGMAVGVRFGRLNKHRLGGSASLGVDGYCRNSGLLVD